MCLRVTGVRAMTDMSWKMVGWDEVVGGGGPTGRQWLQYLQAAGVHLAVYSPLQEVSPPS